MWIFENFSFNDLSDQVVWFSDGQDLKVQRGGKGISCRVYVGFIGFFDITDLGDFSVSGNERCALDINGEIFYYNDSKECIKLYATISKPNVLKISDGSNSITTSLCRYPFIAKEDINLINDFEEKGHIPFRNDPNTHNTPAEIKKRMHRLAKQYFPFTENGYQMALSIYDWTTADFFRMDLFHLYCYTAMEGTPRNIDEMADGLASANWGTYNIGNSDFMNSFMLQSMKTIKEVQEGLSLVNETLGQYLNALARISIAAKYSLPRVSLIKTPLLYSGQLAIRNLTNDAMAAYFLECPLNNGPVGKQIAMPIEQALKTFMAPKKTVTLKSFISFTADEKEAEQYSNGILLRMSPKSGSHVWGNGITNITPLSDQPIVKNEYTFSPGAQIYIDKWDKELIGGRELTVIYVTDLEKVVSVPGLN